jgi:hypothetical protein
MLHLLASAILQITNNGDITPWVELVVAIGIAGAAMIMLTLNHKPNQ